MNPNSVRQLLALTTLTASVVCGCSSVERPPLTEIYQTAGGKIVKPIADSGSVHLKPAGLVDANQDTGEIQPDKGSIQAVEFLADANAASLTVPPAPEDADSEADGELDELGVVEDEFAQSSTSTGEVAEQKLPIDLLTALRLAGANHLQIALASERIREASARLDQADVLWIPSINLGLGYNRHDGRIQDTEGSVFNVSRQSLYAGGGPVVGNAPLSGGASGPARLFVDLSLSDVYFAPLVAQQEVRGRQFESSATFNDSLLQVALIYQELVRAQMQVNIAAEAVRNAAELARITENFAKAGEGLEADAQRARAELKQRENEQLVAEERVQVVSAQLVRLLRLDPTVTLLPVDPQPLPLNLLPEDVPIEGLLSQALTRRPELAQHQARVAETLQQIRQEEWRPWLPNLFLGYAGAGFGGGTNSFFGDFGGRGDFDALAVWEVKNFGLGNRALRQERESQHRQAHLQYQWVRDQIAAEVSQAYYRSTYRREQIDHASRQVAAAADALPLNFNGIRNRELRPIEAQQAIAALASARNLYLASIIDYNQAQLELLRAVGEPPAEGAIFGASETATVSEGGATLWPSGR